MWEKHYAIGFTKVDDKAYVDAGLGTTMSGHSSLVMMRRNDIVRWLHIHSELIKESRVEIEEVFANLYEVPPKKMVYKVRLEPLIQIYEEATGDVLANFPNYITKAV